MKKSFGHIDNDAKTRERSRLTDFYIKFLFIIKRI